MKYPFTNKKIFRTGKLSIHPVDFTRLVCSLGSDKVSTILDKSVDIIIVGKDPSSIAKDRYDRMVRDSGYKAKVYSEEEFYAIATEVLGQDAIKKQEFENNPIWYRRIVVSGNFSQHHTEFYRQALQKKGALLYPDSVSKNTNCVLLGDAPDKKVLDALEKLEFNGFKIKTISEETAISILENKECSLDLPEDNVKNLSFSIKHLIQNGVSLDNESMVNPLSTEELFIGKGIKGNIHCFKQIFGNLGAFSNDTMESDTDICVLSDLTYQKLQNGEKDETAKYIENYYNTQAGETFTYKFVKEKDIMAWAESRCKRISDKCTLNYIEQYKQTIL